MDGKNNWYVVTGGPSSGKTTLVGEMAKLGYAAAAEPARTYIDRELAKGRTLAELRSDLARYQKEIMEVAVQIRDAAPRDKIVFFDRSVCDLAAYNKVYGLDPSEPMKRCGEIRYKKIFFLELLPFAADYARADADQAEILSKTIRQIYIDAGYGIVDLPPASLAERVKMVLKEIGK